MNNCLCSSSVVMAIVLPVLLFFLCFILFAVWLSKKVGTNGSEGTWESFKERKRQSIEERKLCSGEEGENFVRKLLGESEAGEHYVFNDFLFSVGRTTCQIDHILINRYGIFVIETKNLAGQIYGDDEREEWTQVLDYGREKRKFYNPVKQNEGHLKKLKRAIPNIGKMFSVVVFTRGDLMHCDSSRAISFLFLPKALEGDGVLRYTPKQMEKFYLQLEELQNVNPVTAEEHRERIERARDDIAHDICPRCGGRLILRNGKNGEFYGCENYPRCRFTKKS